MTNTQYAKHRGRSTSYIGYLIKHGKIPQSAMVQQTGGKPLIDSIEADRALEKSLSHINRKPDGGTLATGDPPDLTPPERFPGPQPKPEIKEFRELSEILGDAGIDVQNLPSHSDLQRLKIYYEAKEIKRKHEEAMGMYILASKIEAAAFEAGKQIKQQCLAIADRCSALVAAENDQFECKQILLKEINYVLEGLSDALKVSE